MKIIQSVGVAAMLATDAMAFSMDINKLVQLQAMQSRFTDDGIDADQQQALMKNVAHFSDMELFLSKQITASDYKQSMIQQVKDEMIAKILSSPEGGIDINNPMWRKTLFGDKDNAELFTETLPEPMQSVIRLAQSTDSTVKAYGKELLKKISYKSFNSQGGNYLSQNIDAILLADDKSAKIKEILELQWLDSIADPIDRAMMHSFQLQKKETDPTAIAKLKENIKDLQKIKIFQGSIPDVSPVSEDNMYAFYKLTQGQVSGADILNLALDDQLGPISDLDFERYFGSPAKQFSCRAHQDQIRVPCGVEATASECAAAGCCFVPSAAGDVPNCFRDLYGKIGSAILRDQYIESDSDKKAQIANLFDQQTLPSLSALLRFQTPYGVNIDPADPSQGLFAVDYGTNQRSWWEAATVTGKETLTGNGNVAHIINNNENRPVYGNPNRPKWQPHGPTQSPYFANMPPGAHPTASPDSGFGDMDTYYKMWLSYSAAQDEAQCALINLTKRVKCMDNYDALEDNAKLLAGELQDNVGNPLTETPCKSAGCCFNEDSFLEGGDACYRAADYGTCTALPAGFKKTNCGYDGITEQECLANTRCCFEPSINTEDFWCFYKYSATLTEEEWCSAWNLVEHKNKPRTECFNAVKSNFISSNNANPLSNVNNLVGREQCEAADCCFDDTLDMNTLEWITNGLGLNDGGKMFRCFQKENPTMVASFSTGNTQTENKVVNHNLEEGWTSDADELPSPHDFNFEQKTCDQSRWAADLFFKRSCGEGLSYYQCVYVNRCCFKQNFNNEPVCYMPERST